MDSHPFGTERDDALRSWSALHIFFDAEGVQDVQSEFAREVVATADSCLGQHIVCTACPYVVLPWQPGVVEQAGRESAGIRRELWAEFALSSVIGQKVSRYGMAGAMPEAVATAKVVPRLKPEQGVP